MFYPGRRGIHGLEKSLNHTADLGRLLGTSLLLKEGNKGLEGVLLLTSASGGGGRSGGRSGLGGDVGGLGLGGWGVVGGAVVRWGAGGGSAS